MGDSRTHRAIDPALVGEAIEIEADRAVVDLATSPAMAADERGLVHGGFVFGLADYAAMLAVNEPNVVLVAASSRFRRPVVVGDRLQARAARTEEDGRKSTVEVSVVRGDEVVYSGEFRCYSPERHVLD